MTSNTKVNLEKSEELFHKSCKVIPGGVNSPARAFKSVGGTPPFFSKANGAVLTDVDGNDYLDFVGSWGPMLFGHSHPEIVEAVREQVTKATSFGAPTDLELEMAELVCEMVPSIEMVRMVNSGTEATMSALRLARAYTEKDFIIKFEGCYHGHGDAFLSQAGSGVATLGIPTTPGVPAATVEKTLNARFNDLTSVEKLITDFPDQIAGVILEPVVGNMGCVPAAEGFLEGLRELCTKHQIVLIFDEVMTGFRLAKGGAQELYGVTPDVTTLGKVIGAGLPVGAYGGKKEIMECVAPVGNMYQAGTLSGNPLAMVAGKTMLNLIKNTDDLFEKINGDGDRIAASVKDHIEQKGYPAVHQHVGSMGTLFFSNMPVTSWNEAKAIDTEKYAKYFHFLLNNGVYMPPAAFEAYFHSYAHTEAQIDETCSLMNSALDYAFE